MTADGVTGRGRRDLLLDRRFLVALAALAVNDHLLKDWLGSGPLGLATGKLSDVAAMMVGPVLMAVLAGSALGRWPDPVRAVMVLAPPGLTLAAINLSVTVAAAYESTLGAVTGVEHRIVVDPTDLIGLVGLVVGWRIVDRPRPVTVETGRRTLAVLVGVAAVGVATASSNDGGHNRDRVMVADGRVVTVPSVGGMPWVSDDDGITWRYDPEAEPIEAVDAEAGTTEMCLRADPAVCVRLADGSTIEESGDGGRTWERVWRVDGDSDQWLAYGQHGYDGSWVAIDLTDLVETPSGAVLVAATTTDPIRRGPDGRWAPSIAELHTFQALTFLPLVIAVAFMMIGLAAVAGDRGLLGLVGMLLVVAGALMALAYFVALDVIGLLLPMAFVPIVVALTLMVLVASKGPDARRVLGRNLLAGLVIVVVAAIPMILWSAGWGQWGTINRVGASLALAGSLLLAAPVVVGHRLDRS